MPAIATPATTDPLKAFAAGASAGPGRPIPLASTRFDVDIDGGFATVTTTRIFRNAEAKSVEATITFPVPVHAVLFELEARIDGRTVKARAKRRTQARDAYEDAIERGKAAVLHEEVLRGVHMLSVAHLGPGKEIEVTSTWAASLSFMGGQGQLRIPLTVGDIYGRSGLLDADDLLTGGPLQSADLFVRCEHGAVAVRGVPLEDGCAVVPLNAPIDLAVTQDEARELRGRAADGRDVVLRISPWQGGEAGSDAALNVAIVVDRSASMDRICSVGGAGHITKHEAVVAGLQSAARGLRDDDIVDLWEFDHRVSHVGSSHDPASQRGVRPLLSLIARLTHPEGGTEIGAALCSVIAGSAARDILLVTDGKSHALDVHQLAQKGRRITVLLVGEDSLEANAGHLAALSGGDIFVAADDDLGRTVAAAIAALRTPFRRLKPSGASPDRIEVVRGNAVLEAEWRPAAAPAACTPHRRGAAALAASLALPLLDAEQASLVAEAEGLVTHLTSLVLVDEEGEVQEGLPATRKIALPHPRLVYRAEAKCLSLPPGVQRRAEGAPIMRDQRLRVALDHDEDLQDIDEDSGEFEESGSVLPVFALTIDWDAAPNQLLAGDLSVLDPRTAAEIRRAAALPDVMTWAAERNLDPTVLVIAILAQEQAGSNRSAARIAKAVLGDQFTEDELRAVMSSIGVI